MLLVKEKSVLGWKYPVSVSDLQGFAS